MLTHLAFMKSNINRTVHNFEDDYNFELEDTLDEDLDVSSTPHYVEEYSKSSRSSPSKGNRNFKHNKHKRDKHSHLDNW